MPQREINETFATYLTRLEAISDQLNKPIIISTDVKIPVLRDGEDDTIEKVPVGWPLYQHNMFYLVTVPPNKHIPRHKHDEDIFRLVVKGSLRLNDQYDLKPGMWFVVRANTPYEIHTTEGYTTIAGYIHNCRTRRTLQGKHLEIS